MARPLLLAVLLCLVSASVVCTLFWLEPMSASEPLPDTFLSSWANSPYASDEAYVLLVLSDPYARLALGLHAALRAAGSTRRVVVLAGSRVGREAAGAMQLSGMAVRRIPPSPRHHNYRPAYRRWGELLSKLEVFRVPVERVVFMDLDVVLRGNPDDLFNRTEPFVASQDNWGCRVEKPGKVNSGVMFIRHNSSTYPEMRLLLASSVVRNGDQELIEKHFKRQLGNVVTLPDSYSTFHTRFADWKKCGSIDQSFRRAKIVHLAAAEVDWEQVAAHGGSTPGLPLWARPFMEQFKRQNDMAGQHMLQLVRQGGVDPAVADFL
eukprot:m51a1_g8720 putative glycogenin-1-like isoform x2 (321) ;mRNA; r:172467-173792